MSLRSGNFFNIKHKITILVILYDLVHEEKYFHLNSRYLEYDRAGHMGQLLRDNLKSFIGPTELVACHISAKMLRQNYKIVFQCVTEALKLTLSLCRLR